MESVAELYKRTNTDLYIETHSGTKFYINHPEYDIEDIAHALANQCRYTGHSSKFYSVAEHCVFVSDLVESYALGSPFEGLMHDAAEGYISDIAAPWKVLLPDYKRLEAMIETPLRAYYGLPDPLSPNIKRADWLALLVEAYTLLPSRGKGLQAPPGVAEQAKTLVNEWEINCWSPREAKEAFLSRFHAVAPEKYHTSKMTAEIDW